MYKVYLDFKNNQIGIISEYQQGTMILLDTKKEDILDFLPEEEMFVLSDNFTFDFDEGTVSVNEDMDIADGEIYDMDAVIPIEVYEHPDLLSLRDEFDSALGIETEEISSNEIDQLMNDILNQ